MKNKGFTLIETVVAIGIFSMISAGIFLLVSSILVNANRQSGLLAGGDQARKAVFNLITELRNAQASVDGAYALATAGDQQVIFYSFTGSTIDRINYFISNGQLKRGVTKPSGNPPAYNLAQETVTVVQDNVANGATPLFYYYNGNYNGVGNNFLTQPVNVTQVKFVSINLRVYNRGGLANTNFYTVTAGGTIRNLKTNLGN